MFDEICAVLLNRRSIRRFQQVSVDHEVLMCCVEGARLAPSAANLQPLEFIVVTDGEVCAEVFECLSWAGYITPAWAPEVNERPMAYIVIVGNASVSQWLERDASFAASNIVHIAGSYGYGSCILCKIDREKLHDICRVPKDLVIDSVVALGLPAEDPVVEVLTDSVRYYRDEDEQLHVPKRSLDSVVHLQKYSVEG